MKKIKIMTILGTRPEIIRLSEVIKRLDKFTDHILVHTGQNWDYELNEVFFEDLKLRNPDHYLGVGGGSLGETLGGILTETEKVILAEKPDAVLILGDTNSAISSIIVRRHRIPIYHMEAGNRSFDKNVPEEMNRKMVDHISDFNLVYTEHARRHLISEGLPHRRIYLTGSPMREVLTANRSGIEGSKILSTLGLKPKKYIVASLHREENVDESSRLQILLDSLNLCSMEFDMPIVFSTHPRTRAQIDDGEYLLNENIMLLKPFGFVDYNCLQMNSFCVISDSGTLAEESSILNFPAVTPRDAIERPEALDAGTVSMTGIDTASILASVLNSTFSFYNQEHIQRFSSSIMEYQIDDTAARVVSLILGTAKLSNSWDGIRSKSAT